MLQLERDEARQMPAETQRVYVYGIVRLEEGGEGPGLPPLMGLAGSPVRTIASGGLAAIASALETPEAGVSFEDELRDPERARSLILEHYRVLRRAIDDHTVLPARFGALFPDDVSVADALHEHRPALLEALERVEGAREWGVKIFCDRSVLRGHLGAESLAMRAAQSELAEATDGRAFFLRRRLARLGDEAVEHAISQHVDVSRESLCDVARADAAMKLQPAAVHGRVDEMVWNGAFLVARPAEQRFSAVADELLQAHASHGFHYEVTGPWPPFSFAHCRLGGRENDCPNGA